MLRTKRKDSVFLFGLTEDSTRECGKTVSNMAREHSSIRMVT